MNNFKIRRYKKELILWISIIKKPILTSLSLSISRFTYKMRSKNWSYRYMHKNKRKGITNNIVKNWLAPWKEKLIRVIIHWMGLLNPMLLLMKDIKERRIKPKLDKVKDKDKENQISLNLRSCIGALTKRNKEKRKHQNKWNKKEHKLLKVKKK